MHRPILFAVALASTLATPAWADHWDEDAEEAGLVAIAQGIYAVPSSGAPIWYAAPNYYSCSGGVWSASPGGGAPWQTLAIGGLPQDLAYAVDAAGHAQYGLCPGDPLPPPAAAYLGGPTVVITAGLPHIVRYGRLWRGWSTRYGHRPVFLPPPFALACHPQHMHYAPAPAPAYYRQPVYAPAYAQPAMAYRSGGHGYGGGYVPHQAPAYSPPRNIAPAPHNWGGGHGGQWGGQPAWNGGGHGRGGGRR